MSKYVDYYDEIVGDTDGEEDAENPAGVGSEDDAMKMPSQGAGQDGAPNSNVYEIMDLYHNGKALLETAGEQIKNLFGLYGKERITNEMLYGKTPKGISDSDYKALVDTYVKGDAMAKEARERMIKKLDMFIYYVIEKQFSTFKKYTRDLYQEGVLGILKGLDNYDPQKSKPTTFFYIYIIHEMTEFINMNINKTTSHYSASIVRVKKEINRFEREGREWTVKDIAQETKISAETIVQSLNIMENSNEIHYETVDFLDSQMAKRIPSPEEEYLKGEQARIIRSAVDTLPDDEANVVRLRYGLSGSEPMAYKTIAKELNIQIDKVKKLHNSAIRKLRNSRIINGNFKNLREEERALNSTEIGIIPVGASSMAMDELDQIFAEEDAEYAAEKHSA